MAMRMFTGVTESTISVDADQRFGCARADFLVDGQVRWWMSVWLDGGQIEGFVAGDDGTGADVVVRNMAVLEREPVLRWMVEQFCHATGFTLVSQHPSH